MDSLTRSLEEDGFVRFPRDPSFDFGSSLVRMFDSSENSQLVNSVEAKRFIDDYIIQQVNAHGEGAWDAAYLKFRVSCNTNSSDASAFHRDNFAKPVPKKIRVYTALCYLDPAEMEIVQGSHQWEATSTLRAITSYYRDVLRLSFQPGDVMIFDNSLLHRGVFTAKLANNRRLVQVFDITKNLALLRSYHKRICHLPNRTDPEYQATRFQWISKKRLWSIMPNFIGYLNAATGYGPNDDPILNEMDCEVYSSEGNSLRSPLESTLQKNNTYVLTRPDLVRDVSPELYKYISYVCYQKPYSKYLLFVTLCIAFFVVLVLFFLLRLRKK